MAKEPDPAEVAAALQLSIGVFVRRLRQSPVPGELTLPELAALSTLDQSGPATPSALARAEQITPQAMCQTLSMLTQRGLVERHPDPGDGRRTVMSLTETGRWMVRDRRSDRTGQLAQALAGGFSHEELDLLLAAAPLIERLGKSL